MKAHNAFQRFVQKFASSRPGIWVGSHFLHYFDRGVYRLSSGQKTLSSYLSGLPMVVLTTTGARSGLKRTTPLVAIRKGADDSCFALIASNWGQDHHPGWYFNLKANPVATCTIDGVTGVYRAHEACGEEYNHYWQRASQVYFGYTIYKQRLGDRRIPIMVLEIE
jgi:deazaflavin-dependent oxidoreductase (nitroreductase family)